MVQPIIDRLIRKAANFMLRWKASGGNDNSSTSRRALVRNLCGVLSGCFGLSLSGCVPMTSMYEKIDVPGAVYFKEMCYASVGPPSVAYYPFHGIFISMNFSSTELGIHVPAGTTVQLNDDTIRIAGTSKSGQFEKSVRIKAFKQGSSGNG